ncbi:AfsR/SARP family transcriptional regulator [Lentzea roselyniae]|uniref:AfsR/SARP family transcriptional regulator n=1 Tax=Lentzea roselyniae TaxID=531940 RepID=UPI0031F913AA
MTVEFGLLGDLEVRVDGRLAEIGHVKQRSVLVALLAEQGRPVPVDRLIDRVWGERAPARARDTLYGYLSKLRQVLDIQREPGGYRLRADSVDLHRFRTLVEQARTQTDERALELFDEAIGLWRGPALAGLDSPWLAAFREELNVERVEAELDRTDLAIKLGRNVLPELRKAAAERPVDERLIGQLMLALHRAGNSAEALRHYEALRQRLADELGVDPGAPLRVLHEHILTANPAPTPRQLPAPQQWFTGRTTELAGVRGEGVTVIAGAGGVGKTALAVQWAHRHLDDYPDGQLYVNLRGFDPSGEPVTTGAALRGFLDALGEHGGQVSTARFRSLVAGKLLLILLDNARDTEQVAGLLPGTRSCAVLVTSRNRLPGLLADGAHLVPLDVLGGREARELLASRLGRARVAAEPGVVTELVGWCGGLPLALSIVAARARRHGPGPPVVRAGRRAGRVRARRPGRGRVRSEPAGGVLVVARRAERRGCGAVRVARAGSLRGHEPGRDRGPLRAAASADGVAGTGERAPGAAARRRSLPHARPRPAVRGGPRRGEHRGPAPVRGPSPAACRSRCVDAGTAPAAAGAGTL